MPLLWTHNADGAPWRYNTEITATVKQNLEVAMPYLALPIKIIACVLTVHGLSFNEKISATITSAASAMQYHFMYSVSMVITPI